MLAFAPLFASVPESAVDSPPPTVTASASSSPGQSGDMVQRHEVRALPGQLDGIPMFNSNSPEVVQREGILLSTFPAEEMAAPRAHLDFPLQGRFNLFAHHIARGLTQTDRRSLFLGVLVHNPGQQPVKLEVLQGVSYLSQEAPFHDLPAYVANPNGNVYAGPGSRTMTDMLQDKPQEHWPDRITIPPGHVSLLMNVPIPLRRLTVPTNGTLPPGSPIPVKPTDVIAALPHMQLGLPLQSGNWMAGSPALADGQALPSNGRTALMYLSSDGPVHLASLAMYAPRLANGDERVPTLSEWIALLKTGDLAGPRDISPTPPENKSAEPFYYGRVAGVAQGERWDAIATDDPDSDSLSIPNPGEAFSYVISTLDRNTLGTGQIQSAPMLARYPDTAYRAHGNYGVHYSLTLPLKNPTDDAQMVLLKFQTPLQDESLKDGLRFRQPPDDAIFFRGTVRIQATNRLGLQQSRYVHLVQRRGQAGEPLLKLELPPGEQRQVVVDFLYPPDATPPQVITVQTTDPYGGIEARAPQD
ncbi:DUF3370 domain-containing protein [Halomicronema hongdechloris]|nr:DUF3370 domain-containing protein [Halomicronema hongdechloris]